MKRRRLFPASKWDTTAAEDILLVAYRLDQTAAFKRSSGHTFLPTIEWLKEQARILRKALEKEGLVE